MPARRRTENGAQGQKRTAFRDAAAGRPCAAARGRPPTARSRPVRPPPVRPSRAAGGRSNPPAAGRARPAGRRPAARAGPGVAGGSARACAGRPCVAPSRVRAWPRPAAARARRRRVRRPGVRRPGVRRPGVRLPPPSPGALRPWGRAYAGRHAGGYWPRDRTRWPAPSEPPRRGSATPTVRCRSPRRRSMPDRPGPATHACRCGDADGGGGERRGLLMGVARSPAHIMAHDRVRRRAQPPPTVGNQPVQDAGLDRSATLRKIRSSAETASIVARIPSTHAPQRANRSRCERAQPPSPAMPTAPSPRACKQQSPLR